MAQTHEGAMKIAAKRSGCSLYEYNSKVARGEKWCVNCKDWHLRYEFGKDASRYDGLASSCRLSRNNKSRTKYVKKQRVKGRSFVEPRDGDKKQARRRINYFVEASLIPAPCELPCHDCGSVWTPGDTRHEYDHYLGYDAEHHEHVQAVCVACHRKRESDRRRGKQDIH